MLIFQKGVFYRRKDEFDSQYICCPIKDFNRNIYMNLRILLRICFFIPFFYPLGNMLFYLSHTLIDVINYFVLFFGFFILFFYLLQIPTETIKAFCFLDIKNTTLKLLNRKRLVTTQYLHEISKSKYFFATFIPFFITNIVCFYILFSNENSITILSLCSANLVLSAESIINSIMVLFANDPIMTYELPNKYFIKKEISVEVDDQSTTTETLDI